MKKLAVVLAALMIAACNPTTKSAAVAPTDKGNNGDTPVPQKQQPQEAQEQSVYFEFAQSSIDPQYNATIQHEVDAIKGRQGETVRVEGNADERGSAEYNLGLGQRRADAVKKRMVAAGVSARQIKAVSLGKEKPKATCHDESCWKENRRVDFLQQG